MKRAFQLSSDPVNTRRREGLILSVFILLTALAAVQFYNVFMLRFRHGDAYPEYSSYRADPMGTQALFRSLDRLPELEVLRNERDLTKLDSGKGTTLIIAGAADSPDPKKLIEAIERFVRSGGRLIVAFQPSVGWLYTKAATIEDASTPSEEDKKPDEAKNETAGPSADWDATQNHQVRNDNKEKETEDEEKDLVNIKERWGFALEVQFSPMHGDAGANAIRVERLSAEASLPKTLVWRTPCYFDDLADHWTAIYSRTLPGSNKRGSSGKKNAPVVVERAWGAGSIVLCSDSYFLSNEAMRSDRYPEFLAWLIGPNSRIIFDETHLGISRVPGVMTLIRGYRLHGVLFSLLVLVLLFIWRSAVSLTPRHGADYEREAAEEEIGRDHAAGLNSLLRRSVPLRELLKTCCEEWLQDYQRDRRYGLEADAALQRIILSGKAAKSSPVDIVSRYRAMCAVVKERNKANP